MTEDTLYAIHRHWHSAWIAAAIVMVIGALYSWYEAVEWQETLVYVTIAAYWLNRIDNRLGVLLTAANQQEKE